MGIAWRFHLLFGTFWCSHLCLGGLDKLYTLLVVAISVIFTSTNAIMIVTSHYYNDPYSMPNLLTASLVVSRLTHLRNVICCSTHGYFEVARTDQALRIPNSASATRVSRVDIPPPKLLP
jgi:hypothetical protein